MKKSALIIAIISLAISACTTQKQATSSAGDDVYNSSSAQVQPAGITPKPTSTGAQVITSPDNTTVKKPSSSSLADDYNDYSYSSRINRFSSKDTTKGYFDDAYSSAASNSNTGSSEPNVNVYLGGGYGDYYGSSFSYGMGWGYPYSSWGWDYGWGYPYYGWGYPYYGWGYPYYGYSPCCYCYGYNDWYGGYPPYYSNSYYYGARTDLFRHTGTNPYPRTTADPAYNTGKRNTNPGTDPTYSRTNVQPSARSIPANQEQYHYTRTDKNPQANYQRSVKSPQNQTQRQQPTPRYIRPENSAAAQRSGSAQSYSSPVYRQPKSSKEYLTPRSQNPGVTRVSNQNTGTRYNSGNSGMGSHQNSNPSNNTRTYTPSSRSGSSGNPNAVRSTSTYNAPTRSGNSGTYSSPSRSSGGGSYSAPARSGGSSGGSAPSGGGGSSGGGGKRR